MQKLDDSQVQAHPFDTQSSQNRTALSIDFGNSLSNLVKDGNTILLHCGESAAMDFILVTLEKEEEKHILQIRLADAKFKNDPANTSVTSHKSQEGDVQDAREGKGRPRITMCYSQKARDCGESQASEELQCG